MQQQQTTGKALLASAPSLRALLARVNGKPGKHADRIAPERPATSYEPRHCAPEDES